MSLKNIQTDYKEFLNHFATSHNLLAELIPTIRLFLVDYCNGRNHDEKFAYNLDINLLLLQKFSEEIEELFNFLENISILELKQPIKRKIKFRTRKHLELANKNDDIYIDLNFPLDWKNL